MIQRDIMYLRGPQGYQGMSRNARDIDGCQDTSGYLDIKDIKRYQGNHRYQKI